MTTHSVLTTLRGSTHFENARGELIIGCDCSCSNSSGVRLAHWSMTLVPTYVPLDDRDAVDWRSQEIAFEEYDDDDVR